MTHAYSEMYLEDAMRTLGEAVDFALCDQGLNPNELTAILSNALEMKQFERGITRVICGMSGDELARIYRPCGTKTSRMQEELSIRPFPAILGGMGFGLYAMDEQLAL